MTDQTLTTVDGLLASWRWVGESGWGLGVVRSASLSVPVTGKLVGARVGDQVSLTGHWETHPKYGRQFRMVSCTAELPVTRAGVLAWLQTTLPNIGAQRAATLYDTLGSAGLWLAIECDPAKLTTVPGITMDRALALQAAYMAARDDRDSMVALRGWGLTDTQIKYCLAYWGTLARVVDHVRANPYDLIQQVHGFGWERADRVAQRVGVPHDAPERITAAVDHVLGEALQAGHCYLAGAVLQRELMARLQCNAKQAAQGIRDALAAQRVAQVDWRFYPAAIERAEQRAAHRVRQLLGGSP